MGPARHDKALRRHRVRPGNGAAVGLKTARELAVRASGRRARDIGGAQPRVGAVRVPSRPTWAEQVRSSAASPRGHHQPSSVELAPLERDEETRGSAPDHDGCTGSERPRGALRCGPRRATTFAFLQRPRRALRCASEESQATSPRDDRERRSGAEISCGAHSDNALSPSQRGGGGALTRHALHTDSRARSLLFAPPQGACAGSTASAGHRRRTDGQLDRY